MEMNKYPPHLGKCYKGQFQDMYGDVMVAVTNKIRYLASGNSYKSIGYSYRVGDGTVSKIVSEVSTAVWNKMQPLYLPSPTTEMWQTIASDFNIRWHFPLCVGALDGKHIVIQKPKKSESNYFNYKHTFSVVLLATVDASYKFTTIDIGSMGRFSDGNIFASSALWQKIISNSLHLPKATLLPSCDISMPYVFVADEAFPLAKHIMRPYPRQKVLGNKHNKIFNYRLSRARQTVECAFGILASRFRVFRKPFESKVDTVVRVGKAACVLHNYLTKNWNPHNHEEPNDDIPTNQLMPMTRVHTNSTKQAFEVRRNFTTYFSTVGVVSWQDESIARGKF